MATATAPSRERLRGHVAAYVVAFVFMMLAYRDGELSVIYPLTAGTALIVAGSIALSRKEGPGKTA